MLLLRLALIVPLVQVAPFIMPSLSDMWKLAKLGFEIGSKIKKGYDFYEGLTKDKDAKIDKVLEQVAEISNKIDGFESRLDQRLDAIVETLVSRITLIGKLDNSFLELHKLIVDVDQLWDNYMKYSKDRKEFHSSTLKAFIRSATGDQQGGLQKNLNQIHRLLVPLRTQHIRDSLFLTMLKYERETALTSCDEGMSHAQAIHQIYYSVAITELRGFVMAAWAYGLKPRYEKGKYTGEVNAIEARFALRARDYMVAAKEAMSVASNRLRVCDPKAGHKKGLTFVELEEAFQTYIINEADIHPSDSCKATCGTIGHQTYRRKTDSYKNYNYDRPCWGTIRDCRYGGGKMTTCDTKGERNNSKRYYWFKDDEGTVYGDNSAGCPGQTNWPKGWTRGFYRCDYCICTCENDKSFNRAKTGVSLRPSVSDTRNNMVVTGVRLVQVGKIIQIQVREGKLQPEGSILKNTDRWVPLEELEYAYLKPSSSFYLKRGNRKDMLVQGKDFEYIRTDVKTINLDDVSAPAGQVVVGVRLQHLKATKETKDNPLRLEVLGAPYDYLTGKLKISWSQPARWVGVEQKQRVKVKFSEPDDPTKHALNVPTLASNLHVIFQESDGKKDAGQCTIPFWDIQEVVTTPSAALQGIGIFHKGHRDGLYGGYLALRLLSLNIADNLNTTLPPELKKSYQQIHTSPPYAPTRNLICKLSTFWIIRVGLWGTLLTSRRILYSIVLYSISFLGHILAHPTLNEHLMFKVEEKKYLLLHFIKFLGCYKPMIRDSQLRNPILTIFFISSKDLNLDYIIIYLILWNCIIHIGTSDITRRILPPITFPITCPHLAFGVSKCNNICKLLSLYTVAGCLYAHYERGEGNCMGDVVDSRQGERKDESLYLVGLVNRFLNDYGLVKITNHTYLLKIIDVTIHARSCKMLLLKLVLIMPLVHVELIMMPSLTDLWNIAKYTYKVGSAIKAGYSAYKSFKDDTSERIDKILNHVVEISSQIEGFETRLDQRLDTMVESLVARITLVQKLDSTFLELHKTIVAIDTMWDNYLKYSRKRRTYNNNTIKAFIVTATGPQQGGLQDLISQMHRLIVPLRTANIRESLFMTMLKHERESQLVICDEGLSNQETIYQIYYTVALTELRGFAMTGYAYGLRPIYETGSYEAEVDSMQASFTMRTRDYILATKEAMKIASNKIRRCDPKDGYKRGVSFVEFEELFQTYVVAEADIHPDDSCRDTCGTIGRTTFLRSIGDYLDYDYTRNCMGDVVDCRYGGGKMKVCTANFPRRYDWFKESDGTLNGDNSGGCPRRIYEPTGWIRGFYRCDYCVCTCEANRANSKAKRAISFIPAQSRVMLHMVITGIRLVQDLGMIHLQIQEGRIRPGGLIEKGSQQWLPIPKLRYEQAGYFGRYWIDYPSRSERLRRRVDFDFIRGAERAINLDDIMAPEGHVVIGVRFSHLKDPKIETDNPIRLEILHRGFDYYNGKLSYYIEDEAKWKGIDGHQKRTLIKFEKPDIPMKHKLNVPTVQPNLFVKFRETDTKKDAGQSTIPFWDIQEVVTDPPFALSGVGLLHKGHRDGFYGGYMALRLLTFDFSYKLNATLPDNVQKSYQQLYKKPLYSPTGVL
ncbi:uncharacterized protein LOC135173010 [Diachasmimorpha longicaudata]|uniref:uncharacterized protein LOC135173010 n=1 Tax=Diachasmimorpha longicaudata TaxID=58733 RepID=UPI0030B8D10F